MYLQGKGKPKRKVVSIMTKYYETERVNKTTGEVTKKIVFPQDYDMFYRDETSFLNNNDNFTTTVYMVTDEDEKILITRLNKSVKLNMKRDTKNIMYVKLITVTEKTVIVN